MKDCLFGSSGLAGSLQFAFNSCSVYQTLSAVRNPCVTGLDLRCHSCECVWQHVKPVRVLVTHSRFFPTT